VVMAGRQAGGPETYEHNLVRAIAEADQETDYHVYCLSEQARQSFALRQDNIHFHVLRPAARWISIPVTLPLTLMRDRPDLLHATFTPPPLAPVDYVFTHHCFSTFAHPEFYDPAVLWRLNKLIVRGLEHARHILCVSENVRDLTAEKFGIPLEKMSVVYNGISPVFRPVPPAEARAALAQRHGIDGPYLLYAGNLQARKNIIRLLEAYALFRREVTDAPQLVLVGRRTRRSEGIDEALDRLRLRDHVRELGHLPNEDLPLIYSGAEQFVFPSLWEGFGIPVVEAMACGTPVVTSNLSSLPEVCGGAAVLVDPYSVEDIAAGMHRLFTDAGLQQDLHTRGLARAAQFTWERTARETLAVYRRLTA